MILEQITKESIAEIVEQNILNKVYPVGSIYVSVNNVSPADFLGGTWQKIEDTFLLAAGNHAAGSTGGEESVTLSTVHLPAHDHGTKELVGSVASQNLSVRYNGTNATLWGDPSGIVSADGNAGIVHHYSSSTQIANYTGNDKIKITATHKHDAVGNGQAHNNMPPYLAVYMWKRTE